MGQVEGRILCIRGCRVLLDADLAELYDVDVKALNQAVKRNRDRFPGDFMFQLSAAEAAALRSQSVTLKNSRGAHRKYRPFVFTEQGIAMLSGVLRSARAVRVNIQVMRAFVHLRHMLHADADLARRLAALEQKYDGQFSLVFEAIRRIMAPPAKPRRLIGFQKRAEA
jgi:hypothetical protein